MTLPASHIEENFKLEADAYVDLYKVILRSGSSIYLKDNDDTTWQGNTYEGIAIRLKGVSQHADEEVSRPTLTIANPDGVWNAAIRSGNLTKATLIQYRLLRAHLDADTNIYQMRTWMLWRPVSSDNEVAVFELRTQTDGQNAITHARMFIPPEFPLVNIR